ncbi:hypothetical protein HDV00_010573 [Rhizophlyctis rosea]|nr:hypothetical protein HDV00_010573 [Rhizophlyctis rosea]
MFQYPTTKSTSSSSSFLRDDDPFATPSTRQSSLESLFSNSSTPAPRQTSSLSSLLTSSNNDLDAIFGSSNPTTTTPSRAEQSSRPSALGGLVGLSQPQTQLTGFENGRSALAELTTGPVLPEPTATEDVFGLGSYEKVFVTEEDLAKAKEKLPEDEVRTPEETVADMIEKLRRWCIEALAPNPPIATTDCNLCFNFVELGKGSLRVYQNAISWQGDIIIRTDSNTSPTSQRFNQTATYKFPLDTLTDIQPKVVTGTPPMLKVTLAETIFLQFTFAQDNEPESCYKSIIEQKARQQQSPPVTANIIRRDDAVSANRLMSLDKSLMSRTSVASSSGTSTPSGPSKRSHSLYTPIHPRQTVHDHLKITRTVIKPVPKQHPAPSPASVDLMQVLYETRSPPDTPMGEPTAEIHAQSAEELEKLEADYETRRKGALAEKARIIREAEQRCSEILRGLEEEYLQRREDIMLKSTLWLQGQASIAEPPAATEPENANAPPSECQLCYDQIESFAIIPCNHRVCSNCAKHIREGVPKRCPWDRQEFEEFVPLEAS